nr:translation initiation factor IF-2-like [Anser cygnoides]
MALPPRSPHLIVEMRKTNKKDPRAPANVPPQPQPQPRSCQVQPGRAGGGSPGALPAAAPRRRLAARYLPAGETPGNGAGGSSSSRAPQQRRLRQRRETGKRPGRAGSRRQAGGEGSRVVPTRGTDRPPVVPGPPAPLVPQGSARRVLELTCAHVPGTRLSPTIHRERMKGSKQTKASLHISKGRLLNTQFTAPGRMNGPLTSRR